MCGLAAIFLSDKDQPIDRRELAAMADAQAHRGPDGAGYYHAPGLGMAHRRLAIIDREKSQQPMTSQDGRLTLIFNGAIYNFQDLRRELQALGHSFDTAGDTEVLLQGFQRWGQGVFPRLNGMFALALYDQEEDCLVLARDRLGQKPLHLVQRENGNWYIVSEINALRSISEIALNVDIKAVDDYFAFGFVPDQRSIFTNVQKVPAGHFMVLRRGGCPRPIAYWDVDFSRRAYFSDPDAAHILKRNLAAAVSRHRVADVPIGSFLSGGLDSATITALMAEEGDHFAVAHSVSFQNGADEGTDAAALAAQLSVPQKTNWVRPPDHSKMRALATMFGEPFADASALGMAQLCAAAVGDMRVALTGDGADEAFAGYRRHRFHMVEEGVRGRMPKGLRAPLFGALAALYPQVDSAPQWLRARATLHALATDSASAYARAVAMLGQEHRQHLFSRQFHAALQGYRAEEGFCAIMLNAPAQTMLDRIQYADLKFSLPGGILTKVDRTSMAVGLEVRSPFLDNDIIDFAQQLPDDLRLRRGQGKWVLKAATQSLLPNATRQRPKQGFAPPLDAWFRGPMAELARQLPFMRCVTETGWFDAGWIGDMVQQHQSGQRNWGRLLWQLLMFSFWFDQHLGLDNGHQQNTAHQGGR